MREAGEFFMEHRVRDFSFQPGEFGYERIGEFEIVGLLSSPFASTAKAYSFYVVYANARPQRLRLRCEVSRDESVTESKPYRYAYTGAEAY